MSVTMMTTNKRRKLHKGLSNHARSSRWDTDDIYQRDYDQPIHSQKVIPDNYKHDNNDKIDEKFKEGASWL